MICEKGFTQCLAHIRLLTTVSKNGANRFWRYHLEQGSSTLALLTYCSRLFAVVGAALQGAGTYPCTTFFRGNNQTFLKTLTNVFWRCKIPVVENHWFRVIFSPSVTWMDKIGACQSQRPKQAKLSFHEGRDSEWRCLLLTANIH